MNARFHPRALLSLTMAVLFLIAAAGAVSAEKGKKGPGPGRGGQQIVLRGVVSTVEDQGLTLRQPNGSEVPVTWNDETRFVPEGARPEVGMKAQVVARKPASEGEPFLAIVLVLVDRPTPGGEPRLEPPLHGCGTLVGLPETADPDSGRLLGSWTIRVPNVADYTLIVTEDTKITPPDTTPQLGQSVCFVARQTDEGLVAQNLQFGPFPGRGEGKPGLRRLVIRGTVAGLPQERTFPWTLEIAVEGAQNVQVSITQETEIRGELALGVPVTVHARQITAEDGTISLVAEKVCVPLERHQRD